MIKNYDITLCYGEHTFRRVLAAKSISEALLSTMIFVKQELQMRYLDHVRVARPTKSIIKVGF